MATKPFDEIITEHGGMVLRVCRSLLDPAAAEDAWSDTFLAALRAYPDLPGKSNIAGWLVTIAYRKSIDQIRATKRAPLPLAELPDVAAADSSIEGVDRELRQALNDLAPKARAAVIYRYAADLAYSDVARLLGSSEPAARRNAADGIAKLRRFYVKGPADVD